MNLEVLSSYDLELCHPHLNPYFCLAVFDGHGGIDAALFIRENILQFIIEDSHFPICLNEAIKSAFLKADHAFADAASLDKSSGTTALTALIIGRMMLIANAGDCRVVLGKRD
uniref:Protein phosphatase 2C n=1 Tax=Betula platyphylla TaxID=78630 RepID=A0A7D7PP16_BETPL|nr:protein phosphatase 2C [Betula platyphylla]